MIRVGDMNEKLLAIFLATFLASLSSAQVPQNYQCTYGDLQRRVEILYETGVTVPCEVHYYKDTEAPGETQVLWRALNESGYCEKMAENFVSRLQDLGWSCGQGGDGERETPVPEQVDNEEQDAAAADIDDTEALTPAEEE